MRVFSPEEESFLRRINQGQGGNLYNLINPWIAGVSFDVNIVTKKVVFVFDTNALANQGKILPQRLQEIQALLIQAVNLLKLFEDRGYLISYQNANQIPNPFIFGQFEINSPSISYTFPDTRISELIVKYATQEIFVTEELNKFINDGFITREQVNANRQFGVTSTALRTTRNALYISIAGVFLTLCFNVYNSFIKDSHKDKEKMIQEINQHCDSVWKKSNFEGDSIAKPSLPTDNSTVKNDTTKKK